MPGYKKPCLNPSTTEKRKRRLKNNTEEKSLRNLRRSVCPAHALIPEQDKTSHTSRMVPGVKAPARKPANLGLIPGTNVGEGER